MFVRGEEGWLFCAVLCCAAFRLTPQRAPSLLSAPDGLIESGQWVQFSISFSVAPLSGKGHAYPGLKAPRSLAAPTAWRSQ